MLELNGYKYSREEFEDSKFRAMFRISISEDWRDDSVVNIYTNNPDREEVSKVVISKTANRVHTCIMEHWTTKEQDELTEQLIEEFLKDI